MYNLKFKKKILILTLFFLFWFVFAHNPRVVWDMDANQENPILVDKPENSQAFYAKLKWKPDFYKVVSDNDFLLYVSLTIPALSWSDKDYSMMIKDELWNVLADINWIEGEWTQFYEKFAWDTYNQWPFFEKEVWSWVYFIQIYSPDNVWKYVLAIWKLEIRPVFEIWNTFKVLPELKTYFFEKYLITMFFNYVWISLLLLIIFVVLVLVLIIKWIKKFKS